MRFLKRLGSAFTWSVSILAWLIGGLAALLFIGFVWLTATASGTHWLIGQVNQRVDGFHVAASAGTFWSGLTLDDLQYRQADGLHLDAQHVQAQLDWRQFWHLNLQLKTLTATDVQIHLPARPQTAPAGPPIDWNHLPLALPVGVDAQNLSLQRVALILADGSTYRLDDLQGSLQATRKAITLHLSRSAWALPQSVQVSMQGDLSVATASPHRVVGRIQTGVGLPQGWLDAEVGLSGRLADIRSTWAAQWIGLQTVGGVDVPAAQVTASAQITPERLVLDRVAVDMLGGTFCARGQLDYASGLNLVLDGRAEALDPALLSPSLAGRLGFDFHTRLEQPAGTSTPVAQVDLTQVQGTLARVLIRKLDAHLSMADRQVHLVIDGAQIAQGSLKLDAQLGLQGEQPLTLTLATQNLNLAPFLSGLPTGATTRISLKARANGQLGVHPNQDMQLALALEPVDASVTIPKTHDTPALNESLTGMLRGTIRGHTAQIERSQWQWGDAQLTAQGRIDWGQADLPMALTAKLSVPDLARLPWAMFRLPSASGSIQLATNLSGSLTHPEGTLSLNGKQLGVAGWQLARLDAQGRVDRGTGSVADPPVHLQVRAQGLSQSQGPRSVSKMQGKPAGKDQPTSLKRWLNRLTLNVSGRWAQQTITLDADALEGTLAVGLQGGMQNQNWRGMLDRFDLAAKKSTHSARGLADWGHWRLQVPARLELGAARQQLDKACLSQGDSRVCLAGNHQAQTSSGTLTADLALKLLEPWFSLGLNMPGRLKLDAQGDVKAGVPSGHVHVTLPDSRFSASALANGKLFAYRQAHLNAEIKQEQATLDYRIDVPQLLTAQGSGSVALAGHQDLNLSTKITLADLGALSFALPQVSHLTGHATADVQVIGPLMQPKPSGRIQIQDLAFMLPDTGVGYRDGGLNGQIDSQGQLRFSGQLTGLETSPPSASSSTSVTVKPADSNTSTSAEQASIAVRHLILSGTGDLAHLPDWQIQAIIKGNAVPVLRIPSLFVDASPNLTIKADQSGATLGGSMLLPTVTARIEKLPDSAVRSTPDLVIVGAKSASKSPGYPIQGDISLKLGDQVTLAGMGFSTGITGGLDLRLRPGKPITAYGEIDLKNGIYKAYGQNLAIQSGQLIFVGPLTDPGLAVSAARTVDTTVVGLKIGGTLHDPKTTVFSQPSMPESDALSLLLTGRKLNDGSSADASVLLNAIAGLGISQGDDIAREIGQKFGLDTVGLDTTGGIAGTRLTLGKRLGDNLLVRYAVGVTTGVGEVITRYKLNKLFAIEVTASPAATGGDLIYRIH